ncbi:uncharacterized protein LOC106089740 [Stomoxys calcitrans]|uniref:uncharacterized protein LOC106089740 n=1 Tax=Stomoxys calcitrans TaxID=35570 RepID=UPI0027E34BFF|nr:uncharacterized protein LOC106089740 [Stomoxys calcitrans]
MKYIIVCAFFAVVAASRTHHLVLVKPEIPTTEYREQDSKGFYSFGYSGEESAKAEYTTRDGSSKGFYSYIDSDGKLQTVKYEAGRKQGFTASATNLPVQPVDNNQPPEQVTDTPEVEMAKQAHFEAYREAALKAAMEADTDEIENTEMQQASAEAQHNAELQQNTREQLLNRQNTREQLLSLLREHEEERAREEQQSQLMTTYIISAQAEARSHGGTGQSHAQAQARIEPHAGRSALRTVYSMENADSNVILKVGNGNDNAIALATSNGGDQSDNGGDSANDSADNDNGNGNGNLIDITNLRSINLWQDEPNIQNSQDSYFTVDNPNTHYTVEIPTVLTTLPRIESIRVGGSGRLPLAKSTTYITQRLNSPNHVWADSSYVYPVPSQQLQTPIVITKSALHQTQPQLQQYFTQDSLGQYSYGYSEPLSTKQEIRTLNGITVGSYSYVDAHGVLQTVDYTADEDGFRVGATNLPIDTQKPATETPEVALARQQHLAAHQAVLSGDISSSAILPQPVEDTAEVAAAKKEFFARYDLEVENQNLLRKLNRPKSQSPSPLQNAMPGVRSPPLSSYKTSTPHSPHIGAKYGFYRNVLPVLPQRFYLPIV